MADILSIFSSEEFKLWSDGLKPILMDQRLIVLDKLLHTHKCSKHWIRCRQCRSPLSWLAIDDFNVRLGGSNFIDEIHCICLVCASEPIFQCRCEAACNILVDLLDIEHPQLLASALNRILISGNILNGLSPPYEPDNPIEMLATILDQSPSVLKFGGNQRLVIADIFEDQNCNTFPILYITDTVTIPNRCYMHALRYSSSSDGNATTDDNNNNCEGPSSSSSPNEGYLLQELMAIGNKVVLPDSLLVLGPKLQHLISPKNYKKSLHNLSMVIRFDDLRQLDQQYDCDLAITDHYQEVIKSVVIICRMASMLVYESAKESKQPKTKDMLYADLQRSLTAAVWLKTFSGTPFEVLLYHILDGNHENSTTTGATADVKQAPPESGGNVVADKSTSTIHNS